MIKLDFLEKPKEIPLAYIVGSSGGRTFRLTESMLVTLSDGYELLIEEGYETDLMSIPKWGWSIIPPFDSGLMGDLIHDKLYSCKQQQFEYFDYNVFESRKFADNERLTWRKSHAPDRKIINEFTHRTLRLVGGLYYSRQLEIPN